MGLQRYVYNNINFLYFIKIIKEIPKYIPNRIVIKNFLK